jgi:hypothetical protein
LYSFSNASALVSFTSAAGLDSAMAVLDQVLSWGEPAIKQYYLTRSTREQ